MLPSALYLFKEWPFVGAHEDLDEGKPEVLGKCRPVKETRVLDWKEAMTQKMSSWTLSLRLVRRRR